MRAHEGKGWLLRAVVLGAALGAPKPLDGQLWFVDGALNQSFTSSDPLPSPIGFEVTAGALQLAGPLGLHLSYRRVSEEGGEIPARCDMSSCTPGPFDQTYTMTTFGLGVSYDFVNPTGVFLTLALTGGSNWQIEQLEHVGTGEGSTGSRIGSDRSLGASAHLRLRPVLAGARPSFAVRYDRILGGTCLQDAACLPGRNVFAVSGGLSWVFGGARCAERLPAQRGCSRTPVRRNSARVSIPMPLPR